MDNERHAIENRTIRIATIGHVDRNKLTLIDAIQRVLVVDECDALGLITMTIEAPCRPLDLNCFDYEPVYRRRGQRRFHNGY
jgi:translation initiation factor IF-2